LIKPRYTWCILALNLIYLLSLSILVSTNFLLFKVILDLL
jgi:hypothetical protein